MKPKIVVTSTDGNEVYGYVYSDDLTIEQLNGLGLDVNDSPELLEVEGYSDEPEGRLWAYNGNLGYQIAVDVPFMRYAIDEYIAFNDIDTSSDTYNNEDDL